MYKVKDLDFPSRNFADESSVSLLCCENKSTLRRRM